LSSQAPPPGALAGTTFTRDFRPTFHTMGGGWIAARVGRTRLIYGRLLNKSVKLSRFLLPAGKRMPKQLP
jgi:hypothetical protein